MKGTECLIRTSETAAVQVPARTQRLSWLLAFLVFSFYLFLLYFFPSSLPLFLLSFLLFFFSNFRSKTQVNWGQEKNMGDRKRCRLRTHRRSYYFKRVRCVGNRPASSPSFKHLLLFFTHWVTSGSATPHSAAHPAPLFSLPSPRVCSNSRPWGPPPPPDFNMDNHKTKMLV